MKSMNNAEMAQVQGGADYVLCGIGAAVTIGSVFYFPFATASLVEVTAMACISGQ